MITRLSYAVLVVLDADFVTANSGGGGAVGGLFTCGEDGADEQDDENAGQEIEEYKDEPREAFFGGYRGCVLAVGVFLVLHLGLWIRLALECLVLYHDMTCCFYVELLTREVVLPSASFAACVPPRVLVMIAIRNAIEAGCENRASFSICVKYEHASW